MIKKLSTILILSSIVFSANANCNCSNQLSNRLTVTGVGKTKVMANIAEVNLSTELKSSKADHLQNELAKVSKSVIDALKKGKAKRVETDQIFITPNYDRKDPQTLLGYRGRISILFESNAKDAGKLISDAVKAGANKIDGIWLKPSIDVQNKANSRALQLASQDAINKADTILDSLGLSKTTIKLISSSSKPSFGIHARHGGPEFLKVAAESIVPEVTEKEQEIEAELTMTIGYEE